MGDPTAGLPPPPPRPPGPAARLGWYLGAAAVTVLVLVGGLRLWEADLRAPLYYAEDALLILPMVKAAHEGGTHWVCHRLGAPGVQELNDFPVIDHVHFVALWLLGLVVPDTVLVFNLYHLLTYPLTTLVAMAVFRAFGLSLPAAAAGGLLFAFAPYHYLRGEKHYFLAAYYHLPLAVMVALWVCRGDPLPFFPADETGRRRFRVLDRASLLHLFLCAVIASAGAYYAYFTCALYLAAGLYGAVAARDRRPAVSAALLIAAVVAAGVANHAPTLVYQWQYGRHSGPTARSSDEAEMYGLKLAQMLLPIDDHSLRPLAAVKSMYNSVDRPVQHPDEKASLGAVAAAGFVGLIALAVLPVRRAWPYGPLAGLTAALALVGTVGGFGAVFNHVVTPQVRCYNRLSIVVTFLALFAAVWAVDRWLAAAPNGWLRRRPLAVWAALAWFGVWDQTPYTWTRPKVAEQHQKEADRFRADAEFYRAAEDMLNPGGEVPGPAVFMLPHVLWPESPWTYRLAAYEHARGYLHTRTLRWSFGSIRGRETDEWAKRVAGLPAEQMVNRAIRAGFEGLLLDRRGYSPTHAEKLYREVTALLGSAPQVRHRDGQQVVFDLRPFRDWVRAHQAATWEAECRAERHPLAVLWLDGFISFNPPSEEWAKRWCGPCGLAVFVNPTDRPKTFNARFHVRTDLADPAVLRIDGGDVWSETLEISKFSPVVERTFTVPPGRHPVRFRCTPPPSFLPGDARSLLWYIGGFRVE